MSSLSALCFSDPHWGDCPVTGLCNYQTYVLFTLGQLKSLDTLSLADETKQLALATFMKKKMYYNMRIKTVRRNANNALRRAAEGRDVRVRAAQHSLGALLRQLRDVERELREAAAQVGNCEDALDDDVLEQLRAKRSALAKHIDKIYSDGHAMSAHFDRCRRQVYNLTEVYVRRLLMELSTGGNIRMEDGRPSDLWYSSCVDLVKSRFFPSDYDKSLHISGLRVTRVRRIHCRYLRNRFEERLEAAVDTSDAAYKRSLEYLFYGEQPGMHDELHFVIEEGFRSAQEYAAQGSSASGDGDAAVALSNSLSLADKPRLSSKLEALKAKGASGARSAQNDVEQAIAEGELCRGKLLVTKVYLGKSAEDHGEGGGVCASAFPDCDSVYRVQSPDRKQRSWLVFDHALVLPEYLVEFKYELQKSVQLPVVGEVDEHANEVALETLDAETRGLARPVAPYLALLNAGAKDGDEVGTGEPSIDPSAMTLLRMPPSVARRSEEVMVMTDDVLLRTGGKPTLDAITHLDLHGNALRKIEGLSNCPALRRLVLSFNEINSMAGLCDMSRLESVDLSYNQIQRVEGLSGLPALVTLKLSSNLITRLEEVNVLKKYAPQLRELCLLGNAICEHKSYYGLLLRRLPKLELFDQRRITAEDHARASDSGAALSHALVREGAVMRRRALSEMVVEAGAGALFGADGSPGGGDAAWLASVEQLVLEHRRIRRMQALDGLINMRRLSLCDNDITVIEELQDCTRLEELSLEDNRITQMSGLSACLSLKRLDLGSNSISKIESLEHLTALTQLGLENNQVSSLEGLQGCVSLMELYLGNNRLEKLRQVQLLKSLPKLIILDLSDNPLCGEPDYRHYVVYHLNKLKVLDGIGIDSVQTKAARSKYAGRLTFDLLEEKLGTRSFEGLRELDIVGMRLRNLGTVFSSDTLHALKELNLDGNSLSDVSALRVLPHLSVLRLNRNKLGSNQRPLFGGEPLRDGGRTLAEDLDDDQPPPICNSLSVLQLGGNRIAHVGALGLDQCQKLRVLFLQDNDIQRVEGLEALVELRELVLDRNRIKYLDADVLAKQEALRELRLEGNGLRSLANLGPLPGLHSLHLSFNRISDVAELECLSELKSLTELSVSNNPVSRKQLYRATVVLRCEVLRHLDGREITTDERDHVTALFLADAGPFSISGVRVDTPQDEATSGGTTPKVALKVTSMSFEALTGPSGGGARLETGEVNAGGGSGGGAMAALGNAARGVGPPPAQRGGSASSSASGHGHHTQQSLSYQQQQQQQLAAMQQQQQQQQQQRHALAHSVLGARSANVSASEVYASLQYNMRRSGREGRELAALYLQRGDSKLGAVRAERDVLRRANTFPDRNNHLHQR